MSRMLIEGVRLKSRHVGVTRDSGRISQDQQQDGVLTRIFQELMGLHSHLYVA
jgi:hypothetical protein